MNSIVFNDFYGVLDSGYWQALSNLSEDNFLIYNDSKIGKSSVGCHYLDTMNKLVFNALEVRSDLMGAGTAKELVDDIFLKLLPLGVSIDYPVNTDVYCSPFSVVREVQQVMPEIPKDFLIRYEDFMRIVRGLCVGFTPKDILKDVRVILRDFSHIDTHSVASMLYPWGTQPYEQLQLLASTLDSNIISDIWDVYTKEGIFLGRGLNQQSNLLLDVHTDFLSYSLFKSWLGQDKLVRQFWTPFFGFLYPNSLQGISDSIRNKIDFSVKQSYKLYYEILKTGLDYDSQYSVLMGFRGRFYCEPDIEDFFKRPPYALSSTAFDICRENIKNTLNLPVRTLWT